MGHEVAAAAIGATVGAFATLIAVHLLHKVNGDQQNTIIIHTGPGSNGTYQQPQLNSGPTQVEASASPKAANATNHRRLPDPLCLHEGSGSATASAATNEGNDAPSSSGGPSTVACSPNGVNPTVQASISVGDVVLPFNASAAQAFTHNATVFSGHACGAAASSSSELRHCSQPRADASNARKLEFDAAKADEAPRKEIGLKGSRMLYGKANGNDQWKVTMADGCELAEDAPRRLVLEKDVLKWLNTTYLEDLKS
eukprot:GEMP01060817.1.p1 GENE.GEMP01060817.1~~GEMP01060817.1.p1  ORF type:complete len:255 (+),score=64.07 GEMP01060817.1:124-888(+)